MASILCFITFFMATDLVTFSVKLRGASDIGVVARPEWTVLDVKNAMQPHIEGHPAANEQRLICYGRILKDDFVVRDIYEVRFLGAKIDDSPSRLWLPICRQNMLNPVYWRAISF